MKILTLALFQLLTSALLGQQCESIGDKIMNCVDSNSLKQGLWLEYHIEKILTTDSFKRNPKAIGYHNDRGEIMTPIAEGFYKDSKKIGVWIYYVGFYNDPFAHVKTVQFVDSGFRYEIDSFYHYRFKISNDTSFLTGQIFLKESTVELICKDSKCILYNPFRKKREKFKQASLDNYVRWLNFKSFKGLGRKNGS